MIIVKEEKGCGERADFSTVKAIKITADPTAWDKKYLIVASVSCCDLEPRRIGIKAIKLISMLTQRRSQFEEERVRKIEKRRVDKKRESAGENERIKGGSLLLNKVRSFILAPLLSSFK